MTRAPIPDTIEALRVQNGALRTLNHYLEEEIKLHREKAREYHEAIQTLDSEREANARLTAEVEAARDALDACEKAIYR
jgi:hypothetical protein